MDDRPCWPPGVSPLLVARLIGLQLAFPAVSGDHRIVTLLVVTQRIVDIALTRRTVSR